MTSDNAPEENRFDTGAELKRIRGKLTQQEFADLMGVSRNTVVRYENNDRPPDAEYLFKLNLVFRADPTRVLLGGHSVHLSEQREIALLTNYRVASEEDRATIDRMAELAAQSANAKRNKSS
jgi:transcriptional regulator with XRE-family HTH domain